jgi:hypothetical protein
MPTVAEEVARRVKEGGFTDIYHALQPVSRPSWLWDEDLLKVQALESLPYRSFTGRSIDITTPLNAMFKSNVTQAKPSAVSPALTFGKLKGGTPFKLHGHGPLLVRAEGWYYFNPATGVRVYGPATDTPVVAYAGEFQAATSYETAAQYDAR